jgi:ribosomal protein S27AE
VLQHSNVLYCVDGPWVVSSRRRRCYQCSSLAWFAHHRSRPASPPWRTLPMEKTHDRKSLVPLHLEPQSEEEDVKGKLHIQVLHSADLPQNLTGEVVLCASNQLAIGAPRRLPCSSKEQVQWQLEQPLLRLPDYFPSISLIGGIGDCFPCTG